MPFFGGADYKILGTNIDGGNDVLVVNTGDYNIGLGSGALQYNTTGSRNFAAGFRALQANTTGADNIALGFDTLKLNTTGATNIAVGSGALQSNISGAHNIAIGFDALGDLTLAQTKNIAIGTSSLPQLNGGSSNISIGVNSLFSNLVGSANLAIGTGALYTSTGSDNLALGNFAGTDFTTGNSNILIGEYAGGNADPTGSFNIVIGTFSNLVAGANQIVIGHYTNSTLANQITIGDVSHTSIFIAGKDVTNVLTPTPTFTAVTLTGGTVAVSTPVLSATQTWNAGAVAFDLWTADVTNTASSADSTMLNLKLGGTSLLQFKPAGGGILAGAPSLKVGTGATTQVGWLFGAYASGQAGLWSTSVTPSTSNYVIRYSSGITVLNGETQILFNINDSATASMTGANFQLKTEAVYGWTVSGGAGGSLDTAFSRESAGLIQINSGTAGVYRDLKVRQHYVDQTITAAGTTGAQTINKAAGTVNFAAAATSLVVTNSLVTANSTIYCSLRTNDATARIANVVPAAGSFTINLTNAATAETSCGFLVIN